MFIQIVVVTSVENQDLIKTNIFLEQRIGLCNLISLGSLNTDVWGWGYVIKL